jgi:hypothetical protein
LGKAGDQAIVMNSIKEFLEIHIDHISEASLLIFLSLCYLSIAVSARTTFAF